MSRPQDNGLATLHQLKQAGESEAGMRLRKAQASFDAACERLGQLERHAEYYRHQTSVRGASLGQLQDSRQFLMQLESALDLQRKLVEDERGRVESARAQWLAARMQRNAVDKLLDRRAAAEDLKARQSEQRLADERTARAWVKARESSDG